MPYSIDSAVTHARRPEVRKMVSITVPGSRHCSDLFGICHGGPVTVLDAITKEIKRTDPATYFDPAKNEHYYYENGKRVIIKNGRKK
jgi:hypothetical protein